MTVSHARALALASLFLLLHHSTIIHAECVGSTPAVHRYCKLGLDPTPQDRAAYVAKEIEIRQQNQHQQEAAVAVAVEASDPQVVFLDFDTKTGGTEYIYTAANREAIMELILAKYNPTSMVLTIVDTEPTLGDYSTIFFNAGFSGSQADNVDFLNQNRNDEARININGLFVDETGPLSNDQIVSLSANLAAHELGHLLGLRHGDSFGPPGTGLAPTLPNPTKYGPNYTGPQNAVETMYHTMGTPASTGQTWEDVVNQDTFFSESSAIKLAYAAGHGTLYTESQAKSLSNSPGSGIAIPDLIIPNTVVSGINAGSDQLLVHSFVVDTASLSTSGETDTYRVPLKAGMYLTAEIISLADENILLPVDTMMTLKQESGSGIGKATKVIRNRKEFETLDPILLDYKITTTATYRIQVQADRDVPNGTGDYKLLVYVYSKPMEIAPPSNDLCQGAFDMGRLKEDNDPLTMSGNTDLARVDEGLDDSCIARLVGTSSNGVWYQFTSKFTCISVSTCDAADFDTAIYVYGGDECGGDDLVCVEGNNNNQKGAGCGRGTSHTGSFVVEKNALYYVLVRGKGPKASGNFALTVSSEDDCPPLKEEDPMVVRGLRQSSIV